MDGNELIYKICTEHEWEQAGEAGIYAGSEDDARDGFIHFSLKEQLKGTLDKHFIGKRNLLLLTVALKKLDQSLLKWETSRNNKKFPHLYGDLSLDAVIDIKKIPDDR